MADDRYSRRLAIEAKYAQSINYEGIQYGPVGDSLDTWLATYDGPKESVYEGTTIEVHIEIPKAYPFQPPVMKTDILHPNVHVGTGVVCMSILHTGKDLTGYEKIAERWNSGKGISACVLGFQQVLSYPNFDSAANLDVAIQHRDNQQLLKNRVQSAFIKKCQQIAYDKCFEEDRMNSIKRERPDGDEPKSSKMIQDPAEEGLQNSKKIKRDESPNKIIQLPEELPEESGGILLKFKTKKGVVQRMFDVKTHVISAFNFLSNCGTKADGISIPGVTIAIDREKAKISTFEDVGIKSSIFVYVYEDDD